MCGFAGFWGPAGTGLEVVVAGMAGRLAHRGPDDAGAWVDPEVGIALGHRRLSIVDLSPAGHQPMASADGRYVLAFNGEIYNHLLLRKEMEAAGVAPIWRGYSDTETLLAACACWGLAEALTRATGMFALALWDRERRELCLARDRFGEKPLYYGVHGGVLLFGSELKALRGHPAFAGVIDRDALSLLLRYNYIPAPYSIYEGIRKLLPGTIQRFVSPREDERSTSFWDLRGAIVNGREQALSNPAEAVEQLEGLLMDAVGQQMVADVPLGAFLSGGVDSSLIVALMQAQSSRPVKTFTIGFNEQAYNEAEHAKAVARHLGTEHTELYVTQEQAMAVIPSLPALYDEPFADVSQIPTWLVSCMAREHVTVALSGDAGDELFCGYNRYLLAQRLWQSCERVPAPLRGLAGGVLQRGAPLLASLVRGAAPLLPARFARGDVATKFYTVGQALRSESMLALNHGLSSFLEQPASMLCSGRESPVRMTDGGLNSLKLDPLEQMMALDMLAYLPDDILVKVDRAAMGTSLETRVPLLDHRVLEFAWRLPLQLKLRGGESKWILRQILYRHVPRELVERPKMGFGVPVGAWLKGGLRDWAEALLEPERLRREGFLRPEPVRRCWDEHQSGRRDWQHALWGLLMFQQWLEYQSVDHP